MILMYANINRDMPIRPLGAGGVMNKTILIVDDVHMYVEIETEFLQYTNTRILTANDGQEALDIIRERRPDLVFMDLQMPRMNGAACCRAVKSDPLLAGIPVVMITSQTSMDDRNLCIEAGCDHLMPKPLDRDIFLEVTRRYLPEINRREKRVKVALDVVFRIHDDLVTASLHDLSEGGAFLATDYAANSNDVLFLSFNLPDGTFIACHARVVWLNRKKHLHPVGFGVRFSLMGEANLKALKAFITCSP
jgi:CheY-like chemotaxis protein/Tfp pilus assembly protein PilZ